MKPYWSSVINKIYPCQLFNVLRNTTVVFLLTQTKYVSNVYICRKRNLLHDLSKMEMTTWCEPFLDILIHRHKKCRSRLHPFSASNHDSVTVSVKMHETDLTSRPQRISSANILKYEWSKCGFERWISSQWIVVRIIHITSLLIINKCVFYSIQFNSFISASMRKGQLVHDINSLILSNISITPSENDLQIC